MADIAGDAVVDPDAQAAVTDFLDYTEYLPSDLIRSLALIKGLDETYLTNSYAVHDLTKVYGALPTLPATSKPDAQDLRLRISSRLDRALNARESAYAEACRLFDLTDRHQDRLKSIITKLHALPKPPSRDPTPQPPSASQAKQSRSGRKLENGTSIQRLTLKPPKGPAIVSAILNRPKHRRVTVPGEVLPPFDPDDPIASTEVSDWDSDPPSPVKPILKLKQHKLPKFVTSSEPSEKKSREPRETTTYRKPTPPPEDAEVGSRYRPWTHLTEYEMYKLRKKMKKNHAWEPSDVMVRRELAEKGRGWENYYKARAESQAHGSRFIDLDSLDKTHSTTSEVLETPKPSVSATTPVSASVPATVNPSTSSKARAGKKMDPKKSNNINKREDVARDKAALAAQEAELAARRLGDIGSAFRNLFSPFSSALASLSRSSNTPTANGTPTTGRKAVEKTQKKRKIEEITSVSPSAESESQKKRQKLVPKSTITSASEPPQVQSVSAGTIRVPLKLNISQHASSRSDSSTSASVSRPSSVNRSSVAPKTETTPPLASNPPSRRSVAVSVEPISRASRRASATPAAAQMKKEPAVTEVTLRTTTTTAASRRSKRDAPGTVTQSSQDGGAAVSVSQRKSKPNKQPKAPVQKTPDIIIPQIRVDVDGNQELVDPDEERYCICHDVSWGEMICCEMDEKCEFGQWFHMECMMLVELPPRTVKWYCPGDRKKLHKGENSNGLVGRGIK